MPKGYERYCISVKHYFKDVTDSNYKRVISVHNNLDDAIAKLVDLSVKINPFCKFTEDFVKTEIEEEPEMLDKGYSYRIVFERLIDAEMFYEGPGAYVLSKTLLQ